MKYSDILYYKEKLNIEFNIVNFIFLKISKELYEILYRELNIKSDSQHEYKNEFTYDRIIFLLDELYKNNQAIFYVILSDGNKNKFATFDIDILSEGERAIKEILE